MVAIVNGQGLGLNFGLTGVLGDRGLLGQAQAGRNGQRVYVNGGTGNLIVQTQDERLLDHGLDLGVLRTYNSQGQMAGEDGGNPTTGLYARRIELIDGEFGMQGSSLRLTDRDGHQTMYSMGYESDRYFAESAGAGGSGGSLDMVDGAVVWRSADGALEEIYDLDSGRLLAAIDAGGHRVDYAYTDSGLLASAIGDSGEAVYYEYAGSNLASVRTHIQDPDGSWRDQTRVRYEYDSLNRLAAVVVDLSPEDNSVADGVSYRTEYRYDGDSQRLAAISQGDGSSLSFAYVEDNGTFRVSSVSEGGASNADGSYNVATTGADGSRTVSHFDAQGTMVLQTSSHPDGTKSSIRRDGAATTTVYVSADGSTSTKVDDGAGYVTETATDASGRPLNTSWSREGAATAIRSMTASMSTPGVTTRKAGRSRAASAPPTTRSGRRCTPTTPTACGSARLIPWSTRTAAAIPA
jgi:YD repeat-containing protein